MCEKRSKLRVRHNLSCTEYYPRLYLPIRLTLPSSTNMTNFSLAIKAVASLAVIAAFVAISSKKVRRKETSFANVEKRALKGTTWGLRILDNVFYLLLKPVSNLPYPSLRLITLLGRFSWLQESRTRPQGRQPSTSVYVPWPSPVYWWCYRRYWRRRRFRRRCWIRNQH